MTTTSTGMQRMNTTAPSVQQVDTYLRDELGLASSVVGHSYQGRPVVLYEWCSANADNNNSTTTASCLVSKGGGIKDNKSNPNGKRHRQQNAPTLLLISLVHGNEPMGLLALLETARKVVRLSEKPIRLLVLPIVNVDAYQLNLDDRNDDRWSVYGDRRNNLRRSIVRGGTDLNRNHPRDWEFKGDSRNSHGLFPWSEPEARAVRRVVLQYQPTAAISYHSRARNSSRPLLIHPYTSTRKYAKMVKANREQYASYENILNEDGFYVYGTAMEAIHYTAGGSTIDWMHSIGVLSLVVEVTPLCYDRWCDSDPALVDSKIQRYAQTGEQMAQHLIRAAENGTVGGLPVVEGYKFGTVVMIWFVVIGVAIYILYQLCRYLSRFGLKRNGKRILGDAVLGKIRRLWAKEKVEFTASQSSNEQEEILALTARKVVRSSAVL